MMDKRLWTKAEEKFLDKKTRKMLERAAEYGAQETVQQAGVALASTLSQAVEDEVITDDLAGEIYTMWRQTLLMHRGDIFECGCTSMVIDAQVEYIDYEGIRHTSTWCDVVPAQEEDENQEESS